MDSAREEDASDLDNSNKNIEGQPPGAGQGGAPVDAAVTSSLFREVLYSVLGGSIAWGVVQAISPVFNVPEEYYVSDIGAPLEKLQALNAVKELVNGRNAMVELCSLGLGVAGFTAFAHRLAQRHWLRSLLTALLISSLAGCLAGYAGFWVYRTWEIRLPVSLTDSVLLMVIMLGTLGVGVGLGLNLALRAGRQATTGALVGLIEGVLTGVVYPLVSALVLETPTTDTLLPTASVDRLVFYILFAALVPLIFARALPR